MGVRAALAIVRQVGRVRRVGQVGRVRQMGRVGVRAALAIVGQVRQVRQVGRVGGKNGRFCKLQYFFLVLSLKLLTFVKSYI